MARSHGRDRRFVGDGSEAFEESRPVFVVDGVEVGVCRCTSRGALSEASCEAPMVTPDIAGIDDPGRRVEMPSAASLMMSQGSEDLHDAVTPTSGSIELRSGCDDREGNTIRRCS